MVMEYERAVGATWRRGRGEGGTGSSGRRERGGGGGPGEGGVGAAGAVSEAVAGGGAGRGVRRERGGSRGGGRAVAQVAAEAAAAVACARARAVTHRARLGLALLVDEVVIGVHARVAVGRVPGGARRRVCACGGGGAALQALGRRCWGRGGQASICGRERRRGPPPPGARAPGHHQLAVALGGGREVGHLGARAGGGRGEAGRDRKRRLVMRAAASRGGGGRAHARGGPICRPAASQRARRRSRAAARAAGGRAQAGRRRRGRGAPPACAWIQYWVRPRRRNRLPPRTQPAPRATDRALTGPGMASMQPSVANARAAGWAAARATAASATRAQMRVSFAMARFGVIGSVYVMPGSGRKAEKGAGEPGDILPVCGCSPSAAPRSWPWCARVRGCTPQNPSHPWLGPCAACQPESCLRAVEGGGALGVGVCGVAPPPPPPPTLALSPRGAEHGFHVQYPQAHARARKAARTACGAALQAAAPHTAHQQSQRRRTPPPPCASQHAVRERREVLPLRVGGVQRVVRRRARLAQERDLRGDEVRLGRGGGWRLGARGAGGGAAVGAVGGQGGGGGVRAPGARP